MDDPEKPAEQPVTGTLPTNVDGVAGGSSGMKLFPESRLSRPRPFQPANAETQKYAIDC